MCLVIKFNGAIRKSAVGKLLLLFCVYCGGWVFVCGEGKGLAELTVAENSVGVICEPTKHSTTYSGLVDAFFAC
jgi:hypothetical protein